jgi:hypothetical protein
MYILLYLYLYLYLTVQPPPVQLQLQLQLPQLQVPQLQVVQVLQVQAPRQVRLPPPLLPQRLLKGGRLELFSTFIDYGDTRRQKCQKQSRFGLRSKNAK